MVIFHSYVSLPEGILSSWKLDVFGSSQSYHFDNPCFYRLLHRTRPEEALRAICPKSRKLLGRILGIEIDRNCGWWADGWERLIKFCQKKRWSSLGRKQQFFGSWLCKWGTLRSIKKMESDHWNPTRNAGIWIEYNHFFWGRLHLRRYNLRTYEELELERGSTLPDIS